MHTTGQNFITPLKWDWYKKTKKQILYTIRKWMLISLSFFLNHTLQAQCSGGGNGGALSPVPSSSYQTMSVTSGNYYTFVVPAGTCYDTYDFSFCSADGSNATHDSQITILDNTGIYVGSAYNDDYCSLQSYVTWTPSAAGTYRVLVNNYPCTTGSTATIAYKKTTPPNMTFTSSTAVDLGASANVEICDYSSTMCRVEIVTSGSCSAISLTQLLVNMTGTASTSTVDRVHVFYTGTSSTFATTTEFISGGKAPAASLTFTGTQTLSAGTNYFWIVYDFNNTGTATNTIGADMPSNSLTVGGVIRDPSATPNSLKTYIACAAYPTNATLWLKGNASTNTTVQGAAISSWGSSGSVAISVTQATGANQPTYQEGSGSTTVNKFNYNPYISYDGVNDYLYSTGTYDLGNGTSGGAGFSLFGILSYSSGIVALDWNGTNGKTKIKVDGIFVINDATTSTGTGNQAYNTPVADRRDLYSIRGKQSGATGRYNATTLTASNNNNPSTTKRITLGANTDFGEVMGGAIGEFLIYPSTLSTINNLKVESYLALKYGVTLGTTSLVSNYLSTAGNIIWSGTSFYQNNIIGIGRDDASTFYQKQSHNLDDTVRIYKGSLATTNSGNASTFASDASYIITGATTGKMKSTPAAMAEKPASCNLYSRIEREWKVTKTNLTESINMDFKLSTSGTPSSVTVNDLRLLVDDDGDFSNGGTTCYYNGDGTGIVLSYINPTITATGISNTHIPNNSTKYITIASGSAVTPLSIELVVFDATLNSRQTVDVDWTTTTETNSDYFLIEKMDEVENWKEISKVEAAGNSNFKIDYSSEDTHPNIGLNYYRLKEVDLDGVTNISEIKVVNLETSEDFIIYPNPANFSFIIQGKELENKKIKIVNSIGQEVNISNTTPSNNFKQFDTSHLSDGIYSIQIIEENKTSTHRLIIHKNNN